MKRMFSGHHSQARPPNPMKGMEASKPASKSSTDASVDAPGQGYGPREVVGQTNQLALRNANLHLYRLVGVGHALHALPARSLKIGRLSG
jgi:hypothetical protein